MVLLDDFVCNLVCDSAVESELDETHDGQGLVPSRMVLIQIDLVISQRNGLLIMCVCVSIGAL